MNKEDQKYIEEVSGCEVAHKIKYLGGYLTNKNTDVFKNNYDRVWKKIKDLLKWNHQKLSLLGRISVIKMNVLPRILYFFRTLPIIKN